MGIFSDILSAMSSSSGNSSDLRVGDTVEVIPYGCDGQIINIVGDEYYVDLDDDEEDEEDTVEVFKREDLRKI